MKTFKVLGSRVRMLTVAVAIASAGVATPSHAGGILTFDLIGNLTEILNAVEEFTALADQLSAIEEQFEQAEEQFNETKEMLSGNSNFGDLFNSADLSDYLPTSTSTDSWKEIYSGMDSSVLDNYREEYGMTSENEVQQEAFDIELTNMRTMEEAYAANNRRLENIQNLQALADSAVTPQEKDDIQARLMAEQAAIANESNRISTTKELMARNEKLMVHKQNAAFSEFLAGEE